MIAQAEQDAPLSEPINIPGKPVKTSAAWLPLAFGLGVLALYVPTLALAWNEWMINDNYAHGVFIFPLCAFLVWLRRDDFKKAERRPTLWGLPFLVAGLVLQSLSYILQLKYVGMWTLLPTVVGGLLMLYGLPVLRIASFALAFSLLASPLPHRYLNGMTLAIQSASVNGTTWLMDTLGYTLVRHGNVIQVPGATLEVAEACSGFHKFLSLLAFTALYAYLFTDRLGKQLGLLAAVLPLALLVNILRISGLVAVAAAGGLEALHKAHDGAEYLAIVLAFGLLLLLGRILGCRTLRFSL